MADYIDDAQAVNELHQEVSLHNQRLKVAPEQHPDFDGRHCVDCEVELHAGPHPDGPRAVRRLPGVGGAHGEDADDSREGRMSTLAEIYAAACEISDPLKAVVREAESVGVKAVQLETSTLESGAMPSEFRVLLKFTPTGHPYRLTPVLR